jgi:hypothetical protein
MSEAFADLKYRQSLRRLRMMVPLALLLLAVAPLACSPSPQTAAALEPSAEERLCHRFAELKNAGDAKADEFLGPAPVVPDKALPPEEAERLHAEFFLRGQYRIAEVYAETPGASGPEARIVLVLKGSVDSPPIPTAGPKGVDRINRAMAHPDIIVEVRQNKIRAVRAQLHRDPGEKPLSGDNARRVRRLLGGE